MYYLWTTLYMLLSLVWLALVLRIVYDVIASFVRDWRPRGANLVVASAVMAATDPPLRILRRKMPPLNLGGVGIDLSFLVVFFVVVILQNVSYQLAAGAMPGA